MITTSRGQFGDMEGKSYFINHDSNIEFHDYRNWDEYES